MKYFLASNSPRRRELLKYLLDDFEVESANITENLSNDEDLESQIMALAYQKAFAVEQKLKKEGRIDTGDIVIGSDTIVYLDGILEKPKDEQDAINMLKKLSGNFHTVYTSLAVIKSSCNKSLVDLSKTKVYFAKMSDKDIEDYVKTGEPLDKAGSYGIQGKGARFIQKIEGDFYSVMGLPINILDKMLRKIELMC